MMGLNEALVGKNIPEDIKKNLALIAVPYFSFDGEVRIGQLVVHSALADDVRNIFGELLKKRFPIAHMVPAAAYKWDDDQSMADNNTSAFNYRLIYRTDSLSNHAYGRAIDINPVQNPYILSDGTVMPEGAEYNQANPGTITSAIAKIFKSYGWEWGGDWLRVKDWQHFEKPAKE